MNFFNKKIGDENHNPTVEDLIIWDELLQKVGEDPNHYLIVNDSQSFVIDKKHEV